MKTSKKNYSKRRNEMSEWNQQVTLNPMPDDISEEMLDEKLFGNQKFIAKQAEPKNRITAADLKKLRDRKKTDVDEGNEFSGELAKARKNGEKTFTVDGKEYPVKGKKKMDEGLYDVEDINPKNRFDYTEDDDFVDIDDVIEEMGENYNINEGNAFGWALKNAREKGDSSFELNGKTYEVTEGKSKKSKKNNKWIQDAIKKPGALKKKMGTDKDENIPVGKLKSKSKELKKKSEGDKKLSKSDLKTSKQVNLALNLKKMNESKLYLSEDEMVELIEKLVREERVKGIDVTNKNLQASKKENEEYYKSVGKKMKDYLKDGSNGEYTESPKNFPDTNGKLGKMKTVAYRNNDAAEEFIENFAYANGMESLNYDEIHPNEKWMDETMEGSSRTGNNPKWANAVETDVNKNKNKVRKNRLYQINKEKVSYNRQEQPVKTKDMGGVEKVDKIFNQLESDTERNNLIKEEFNKIQRLMNYNKKTQ